MWGPGTALRDPSAVGSESGKPARVPSSRAIWARRDARVGSIPSKGSSPGLPQ